MTTLDNSLPTTLTPQQAANLVSNQSAVFIDVREPREYQQEHIAGAMSIPMETLSPNQFPQEKTAILYCGAGKRSCLAAERLMASGQIEIAVVESGIVGWKAFGLPTEKSLRTE